VVAGGEQKIVPSVRRTRAVAVGSDLVDRVRHCFDRLRPRLEARFSAGLAGCEAPQFLRYGRGDRFGAHRDNAARSGDLGVLSRRRVSIVLFVTGSDLDSRHHDGGLLTFFDTSLNATWNTCRVPIRVPPGTAVAFPSDLVHEVTPVRRGTRLTAVSWFPAASLQPPKM
jgi:predicted 2-oxoglutarate/Fe(II)-dependent dioxygenase YbiX